jgi:hypothetical protein
MKVHAVETRHRRVATAFHAFHLSPFQLTLMYLSPVGALPDVEILDQGG